MKPSFDIAAYDVPRDLVGKGNGLLTARKLELNGTPDRVLQFQFSSCSMSSRTRTEHVYAYSALTLFVGRHEEHPACKN